MLISYYFLDFFCERWNSFLCFPRMSRYRQNSAKFAGLTDFPQRNHTSVIIFWLEGFEKFRLSELEPIFCISCMSFCIILLYSAKLMLLLNCQILQFHAKNLQNSHFLVRPNISYKHVRAAECDQYISWHGWGLCEAKGWMILPIFPNLKGPASL